MIDDEKLERYVETYYDQEEYLVRCDTGEDFFQITIQHLSKEPDLEKLVEELFETLAMRDSNWNKKIETDKDHSYAILNRDKLQYNS
jgi:hypothetical protein